jgi:hypothetical protein
MAIFVVWAIFTNFKVPDFVAFINGLKFPGHTSFIVPNEIDAITSWISDPNVVPIIFLIVVNVLILLEDAFGNFWSSGVNYFWYLR